MIDAGSSGKCSRKTALAIYFTLSLVAFVLCLLALISPSWQQVNLENGRTEHHHGLWQDCKRDYSVDYGRTRDYYETLYKYLPWASSLLKLDFSGETCKGRRSPPSSYLNFSASTSLTTTSTKKISMITTMTKTDFRMMHTSICS